MATNIKGAPLHQCSMEHYNRFRLRDDSGNIVAVGSRADMDRMKAGTIIKGKLAVQPVPGTVEHFAGATQ